MGERVGELSQGEAVSKYDPQGFCLPPTGPRLMTTPDPMEIIPNGKIQEHICQEKQISGKNM